MFIKPRELAAMLRDAEFSPGATRGMKPAGNPVKVVRLLRALKRGDITQSEFARQAPFKLSRDRSASYLGTAVPA
jgi:hypothetical protein